MKKTGIAMYLGLAASLLVVGMALAQSAELNLSMSRDWGYGGFNGDIQGLFSMRVTGPTDLVRVEFFIDTIKIGELGKAPFNLQFNTDNYPLGIHQLSAVGHSANGQTYNSNIISANFVPPQSTMKFILPVLVVVVLAILLSAIVPFLANRRKSASLPLGAERNYGVNGGAICPKCHRPFVLPLLGMHLGFSRLAVCPYCGKWSLVGRESIENLRQAEKDELAMSQSPGQVTGQTENEKDRKDIDDSKYQD